MRIVEIRNATASMAAPIANAFIDFDAMTTSVVALVTDVERDGRPVVGYGFNSNGRYDAHGLLEARFLPRLRDATPQQVCRDGLLCPFRINAVMRRGEKPGGHGERSTAVGVVDMAAWDALAKIEEVPLWRLLADRFNEGEAADSVPVYAAGGYYATGGGLEGLGDELRGYLDAGYTRVKMKIGGKALPADLARIEEALKVVGDDGSRLLVDANARFDLPRALEYAQALAGYGLGWYEEPVDPLDYAGLAEVIDAYGGAVATGENLFSMADARNLARHGGMRSGTDVMQFDPVLSYGLVEFLDMLAVIEAQGFSRRDVVPHGGHQLALNAAAGLGLGGNESYPEVFAPFGGFADDTPVEEGRVRLPDLPGVGFEGKADLLGALREATET